MRRKWFDMGHKEEREEAMEKTEKQEAMSRMLASTFAPVEVASEVEKEGEPEALLELLSMEDIYRVAGILTPRKGYSINKLVEMLHSEHLRGLSKEMKRASVLMALDAAGVTVDEVLQDAEARQDAIDGYEADQRKQFELQLARKADENAQIQVEMERVKARYTERLRRNLDGMAREKATFGNWLTTKQQESESMREAVELCLKPPVPGEGESAVGRSEPGGSASEAGVSGATESGAETLRGAGFGFGGFFLTIFRRGRGFERLQKAQRDSGNFIDGAEEGGLVGFGRLVEARNFADKLKRSSADFVFGDRRVEVEKRFDVSAHERNS